MRPQRNNQFRDDSRRAPAERERIDTHEKYIITGGSLLRYRRATEELEAARRVIEIARVIERSVGDSDLRQALRAYDATINAGTKSGYLMPHAV